MHNFTELEPAIYRIAENKEAKKFDLIKTGDNYTIKKKVYGAVNKLIPRLSRLLDLKMYKHISLLMSGGKGLGKTTTMNMVCNLLLGHKIPVIEVKYLDVSIELIEFLSGFRNVVIYIDEFGKYFTHSYQDKILTLLNRQDHFFRIFIIGENDLYKINSFILDRMERTRYHVHLSRIPDEDLKEYCIDENISPDIMKSLLNINKTSSNISYDTLETLAEEHKLFPELNFTELTDVMNCQGIIGVPIITILDINVISTDKRVESFTITSGYEKTTSDSFLAGSSIYVQAVLKDIEDKEEKKEEEKPANIPNDSMRGMSMFNNQHSGTPASVVIRCNSDDIVAINDIDNTMSIVTTVGTTKFEIRTGIRVVPRLK